MKKSDVEKKSSPEDNSCKVKFLCGKRYVVLKDGFLTVPVGRAKGSGRFGFQTVAVRVPVPLVPFLQSILRKCEEIEETRRIVMNNIYNTSPDFALLRNIEEKTNSFLDSEETEEKPND